MAAEGADAEGGLIDACEGVAKAGEFDFAAALHGEGKLLALHGFEAREPADGGVWGDGLGFGVFVGEVGFEFVDAGLDGLLDLGALVWGHGVAGAWFAG